MAKLNLVPILALGLVLLASQISCDNHDRSQSGEEHERRDDHQHDGCTKDKDCGAWESAKCDKESKDCDCGDAPGKTLLRIPGAKPICQEIAKIGETCQYNEQCSQNPAPAGRLSRCNKKCECYDAESKGKVATGEYRGVCYKSKKLGEPCEDSQECKAGITPSEKVECSISKQSTKACSCQEGQKCTNKTNGGVPIQASVTLALVGFLAVKLFL